MKKKDKKELRQHKRYNMHFKVAMIFSEQANRPTFHGITHDISVDGTAVITEHSIYTEEPITVLIAIPPVNIGQKQKILEARAKIVYAVHSSSHGRFRIGVHFEQFKGDGKGFLDKTLKDRSLTWEH